MDQCSTVRDNGSRCINKAQEGKRVCPTHDFTRWCGAPTGSGKPCRRVKPRGYGVCAIHKAR